MSLYGSSKAAINLLTKTWAAEYGPSGVRVNAVSPGPTRTEGTEAMGEGLEQLAAQGPAGRPATADEIAEAIVFLATDRSSFIYGAKLAVDGGRTAYLSRNDKSIQHSDWQESVLVASSCGPSSYCAELHHANEKRCIIHHTIGILFGEKSLIVRAQAKKENAMQTLQADYFTAYHNLKLTRDDKGVLVAEFHSNGGPFIMTAQSHTEFVDAFYRIAQDRANKIVILTGAGGEFITDVDWSSFGDVSDPGVWSQVHDEGVQVLENIANIRVPVIAAIEGRAHVHSDYALLASVIVAAEGATFQDVAHFSAGVAPGDGIFTTWSYRAGAGRAEAFLLNPQPLPARTAYEWGVVAEVVPNGKALSRARELAELYLKAPEVTRRNTRIHFIQPLKERIVREVGYGLSLEGASSADLMKSMQAKSEPVARKGKFA